MKILHFLEKHKTTWGRIKTLIIKEIFAVWRDKKSRITLIAPPIIQLVILSNAATLDVKNISVGIQNHDMGWYSHELVQRIKGSPFFKNVYNLESNKDVKRAVDTQEVLVSLNFQQDFSRLISKRQSAPLQMILDGRKSNAAQIVVGYLGSIVDNFNKDILQAQDAPLTQPIKAEYRSFFNPNIDYAYFMVPSLVAILSMLIALMVTAMSVSRERENGTFDQLLVSPLQPWEILVGKMIPAMVISIAESTLLMILVLTFYDIPFKGSLLLLYASMIVFLFSIVGIGLFISSLAYTQQQSILGAFVFMTPTMLLSGFATPIENMPAWLQPFTDLIPIKYFFIIIKGIFLKDMSVTDVFHQTWPMAVIAIFTLTLAGWMFRRRLE